MSLPPEFTGALTLRAFTPAELRIEKSSVQLWELTEEFGFWSSLGLICAPKGFISDFASVPRAARWYVDDDDPAILFGSIIHDWIYACGGQLHSRRYTRLEADQVLREGMEACGARAAQRAVVYWAVRLGGASHWQAYS